MAPGRDSVRTPGVVDINAQTTASGLSCSVSSEHSPPLFDCNVRNTAVQPGFGENHDIAVHNPSVKGNPGLYFIQFIRQ